MREDERGEKKISASPQADLFQLLFSSVQFATWICLLIVALNKKQSPSVPGSSAHALSQMKRSSLGTFTLLTYVYLASLILKDPKVLNKSSSV